MAVAHAVAEVERALVGQGEEGERREKVHTVTGLTRLRRSAPTLGPRGCLADNPFFAAVLAAKFIAVFPILTDAVDVKRDNQLYKTVSQPSDQPDTVGRPMGETLS